MDRLKLALNVQECGFFLMVTRDETAGVQGVISPQAKCFQSKLSTLHDPDQDKVVSLLV